MHRPLLLTACCALLACGGNPSQAPSSPPQAGARNMERPPRPAAREGQPREPREVDQAKAKGGGKPTVIFVVMDTIRSDNTSLCGYDRPTTPFLESLRDKTRVAWTCNAYSAATWTVPSHASYFTGLNVPEHESDSMGLIFSSEIPVLSEMMTARGYQSVMVSANPTLSKGSGLQRGFEVVEVAKSLTSMRGDEVRKTVRKAVDQIDEDKPLFLFLNIIDAHDPYPRIPADVEWAPPRPELPFDVFDKEMDAPYHRFIKGDMKEDRAEAYLKAVRDGYDYGIYLADQALDSTVQGLRRDGWLKNGFRIVITSDHGEFLGEHQLLRHGCYTWEPVTKVPFLFFDSKLEEQITLPEPFSAVNAFHLVLDGKLPDTPVPVQSYSKKRDKDVKVGSDMAALWLPGREKLVWQRDDYFLFDLNQDPGEDGRVTLPSEHPGRARIEAMAKAHSDHLANIRSKDVDEDRKAELEALGYVE